MVVNRSPLVTFTSARDAAGGVQNSERVVGGGKKAREHGKLEQAVERRRTVDVYEIIQCALRQPGNFKVQIGITVHDVKVAVDIEAAGRVAGQIRRETKTFALTVPDPDIARERCPR